MPIQPEGMAQSTHFQEWLFTREILTSLREEAQQRSIARLSSTASLASMSLSSTHEGSDEMDTAGTSSSSSLFGDIVSLEQQEMIKHYYRLEMLKLADQFQFPPNIRGSALTFFNRFYLHRTVMDFRPARIVGTCIDLACKSEEEHIRIEDLARTIIKAKARAKRTEQPITQARLSKESAAIIKQEPALLEGLRFHLRVYHPHRPLNGFLELLSQDNETKAHITSDLEGKLRATSLQYLSTSYHSDVNFLFTPSQVALAALCLACQEHKHEEIADMVLSKAISMSSSEEEDSDFPPSLSSDTKRLISNFKSKLSLAQQYLTEGREYTIDPEVYSEALQKLKKCNSINENREKKLREKRKAEKAQDRARKAKKTRENDEQFMMSFTFNKSASDEANESDGGFLIKSQLGKVKSESQNTEIQRRMEERLKKIEDYKQKSRGATAL